MINGQIVEKISNAIDKRNNSVVNQADRKYLKYKNAKVTSYDENTSIATVKFTDIDHEYQYYNKSGEILQENDSVKVEYTNNLAQGIITLKYGEWKTEEKPVPYISQKITNDNSVELDVLDSSVVNIDFEVKDNKSDVILNANQKLSLTKEGTVQYTYFVDGIEQNYPSQQIMLSGDNIYTHIIPMQLDKGEHNVVINMKSIDANGNTAVGDFYGAISGQIENINVIPVPNLHFKFILTGVEAGTTINMIPLTTESNQTTGMINWGDGSETEEYVSSLSTQTHVYETSGDYIIKVDLPTVLADGYNSYLNPNWKNTLTELYLPDNLLTFQSGYYAGTPLKYLHLGKSLQRLIDASFANTQLKHIDLPETLIEMHSSGTFSNTKITSIKTPSSLKIWHRGSNNEGSWFAGCLQLVSADIGSDIGEYMFSSCTALSDVVIRETCKFINSYAFRYCSSLTEIVVPEGVEELADAAFFEITGLKKITFPKSIKIMGGRMLQRCSSIETIIVNSNLIGTGFATGCSALSTVVLSNDIKELPKETFSYCYALKNINLPNKLERINDACFYYCNALSEIIIPKAVNYIGAGAFQNTSIKNVTLSENCIYYSNSFPSDCVISGGTLTS